MRFTISRASKGIADESAPCDEAVRGNLRVWSYYTFRSVSEANKRYPNLTFEKIQGGGVRSDRGYEPEWFIEVDTLDALLALESKYGQLVIERHWRNHEQLNIEIYDDYRE